MRASLPFLIGTVLAIAPVAALAQAQPAASQQAARPAVAAAPAASAPKPAHPAAHPHERRAPSARAAATSHAGAPGETSAGVALGASDITGNKELPKVMVIVPWKDSLGAGGVIKPTDSLMDDVLQPVDRGVFRRQIRYYGQLDPAAAGPPATARVAPVGDSH
jgi:hypothetical protein